MNILLTGGTGFLGSHVRGCMPAQVTGVMLVRAPTSDLVWGSDVCPDVCEWHPAVSKVDGIVHLAGSVVHTTDPDVVDTMRRTNVDGTMHMMQLARRYGCPILIASTSGVTACSATPATTPHDEYEYCSDTIRAFPYYQTKVESERKAVCYAQQYDIALTVLRFPMLIGPGERRPFRSLRTVDSLRRNSYPMLLRGGVSVVDVRDVAEQIAQCVEHWSTRVCNRIDCIQVVGANTTLHDMATRMASVQTGISPGNTYWSVPTAIAVHAADWLEWCGLSIGSVTPMNLRMGTMFWWCESSNTTVETRSLDTTLRDTLQYLRTCG